LNTLLFIPKQLRLILAGLGVCEEFDQDFGVAVTFPKTYLNIKTRLECEKRWLFSFWMSTVHSFNRNVFAQRTLRVIWYMWLSRMVLVMLVLALSYFTSRLRDEEFSHRLGKEQTRRRVC
jgi:hypothetical protein